MRKIILEWLFGTDNVDRYMALLRENMDHCEDGIKHAQECIDLIEDHKKTLERERRRLHQAFGLARRNWSQLSY